MVVKDQETQVAYDPFSPETTADPYPDIERLLERCPVHHHPESGLYTVVRWEDVTSMLMQPAIYVSGRGVGHDEVIEELNVLVQSDEPAHGVQRRLVSKHYAPARLEAFQPRLVEICHELIDSFAAQGCCEFVDEFAYAFPIRIVSELLGWHPTPDEVRQLKEWQVAVLPLFAGKTDEAAFRAFGNFSNFVFERVQARREEIERGEDVPDDPITTLLQAEYDGRKFSDMELLGMIQQLMNHETTASMFLHGMYLLLTHPEELDKLRRDPTLIDTAVEEILRFRAPVTGLCRATTQPVNVRGVEIPEGAKVRLMFAAANHDPGHWEDPDTFRIDRNLHEVRRHLSFGQGIHACLGAQVARMEGRVGFLALLDRLPNLRLDPEHPPVLEDSSWVVNTWRSMRLCWDLPAKGRD